MTTPVAKNKECRTRESRDKTVLVLVMRCKGPLPDTELVKFLSSVKATKKTVQIAKKFTSNIPGLVKHLKPLCNSPLLNKNMQQRIQKLVSTLDKYFFVPSSKRILCVIFALF